MPLMASGARGWIAAEMRFGVAHQGNILRDSSDRNHKTQKLPRTREDSASLDLQGKHG
jgi:hypothetical protein